MSSIQGQSGSPRNFSGGIDSNTTTTGIQNTNVLVDISTQNDTTSTATTGNSSDLVRNASNPALAKPIIVQPGEKFISDEDLGEALQELYAEEFDNQMNAGKITKQQRNTLFSSYKLGQENQLSDDLKNIFNGAKVTIDGKTKTLFPKLPTPQPRITDQNEKELNKLMEEGLTDLLKEEGLSDTDSKRIRHEILSNNEPLSKDASAMQSKLYANIKNIIGDVPNLKIDSGAYLGRIGSKFEDLVLAESTNLSPKEQAHFEALFNHADPNDPLQSKVDQARANALAEIKKLFGTPDGFKPVETSLLFDAKLNGTYYSTVDDLLGKNKDIKTSADKAAVTAYMKAVGQGKEGEFDITKFTTTLSLNEIKSLAESTNARALTTVAFTFGISTTQAAKTIDHTKSLSDFVGGPGATLIRSLKGIQDILQNRIDNDLSLTPDQKLSMGNFMKIVSEALSKLSELMFQQQAVEANSSSSSSKAVLGLINDKIAKQEASTKKQQEVRAKNLEAAAKNEEARKSQEAKAATMQWLTPVLFVVTTIIAVAVAVLTAGIATAAVIALVAVVFFVLSYEGISGFKDASGKTITPMSFVMTSLNDAIAKEAEKYAEADGKVAYDKAIKAGKSPAEATEASEKAKKSSSAALALKSLMQIAVIALIVIIAVVTQNPAVGLMIASTLLMESGVFQGLIENIFNGIDPTILEKTPWLATVIAGVILMVLMIAVGKFGGGSGGSSKGVENLGKSGANAGKAAAGAGKAAGAAARAAAIAGNAVKSGAQSISRTAKSALEGIKTSMREALDEVIDAIKSMIKALKALKNPNAAKVEETVAKTPTRFQRANDWLLQQGQKRGVREAADLALIGSTAAGVVPDIVHHAENYKTQLEISKLKSDLAKLIDDLGTTDADLEMLDGMIEMFKTMMEKMNGTMEETGEYIGAIQQLLPKQYQISETTTGLYNAA